MQLDVIGKMYFILTADSTLLKFNLFPEKEAGRRMAVGTFAIREDEAMRLYAALRAWFEKAPLPEYAELKDLRNVQKANAEFKVKQEAQKTAPISAEQIQRQNMAADGRQPIGDDAEIKKEGI